MKNKFIWKIIGVWFLVVVVGNSLAYSANMSSEQFDKANKIYEESKFSEALRLYSEIEKTGSNWKLFYNMGNCYYKLNQPVLAKIYYLKARRLEPFESSIRKNIEIVNTRLNDKIPYPEPDFISRIILRIESIISLNILSFFLIVFVLILNAFIFLLIYKGRKRWIIYGVSFSLFIVFLIGIYHIYRVDKFSRRNIAVITRENSQLHSGPGENDTVLFKVNPGLEVKIIDQSRNWYQVSASSEIVGWIESDSIEKI